MEPNQLVRKSSRSVAERTLDGLSLLLLSSLLLGAAVPTPAPGSAALIPAPNNNPVQFNQIPNSVADANQVNTNFYKSYADLNAIIAYLNNTATIGQSYTCPFCITGINLGTGLTGSITPASASGATATIGFSVPIAVAAGGTGSSTQNFVDLTSGQNIGGSKIFTSAIYSGTNNSYFHYWPDTSCGSNGYGSFYNSNVISVQGVYATLFGSQCYGSGALVAFDVAGNVGVTALYAGTISASGTSYLSNVQASGNVLVGGAIQLSSLTQYVSHGTRDTYPWLANVYNNNTHLEAGATSNAVTTSGATYYFKQPYTTAPVCVASYNGSPIGAGSGLAVSANTGGVNVYGAATGYGTGATAICIGS